MTIPDHVLDAMAEAAWEKIGSMSMEETRNMLEIAVIAARKEGYDLVLMRRSMRKLASGSAKQPRRLGGN